MTSLKYYNNSAGLYGNNIASVAKYLLHISENQLNQSVLFNSSYYSKRVLQVVGNSSNSSQGNGAAAVDGV